MRRTRWTGAPRALPVLAALGFALAGCVGDPTPVRYSGGYYGGPPAYYGSPYYGSGYGYGRPWGGYNRFYDGPRGYYGGSAGIGGFGYRPPPPAPPPPPRIQGPGTQDFLRQHWIDQARRLPPP